MSNATTTTQPYRTTSSRHMSRMNAICGILRLAGVPFGGAAFLAGNGAEAKVAGHLWRRIRTGVQS